MISSSVLLYNWLIPIILPKSSYKVQISMLIDKILIYKIIYTFLLGSLEIIVYFILCFIKQLKKMVKKFANNTSIYE